MGRLIISTQLTLDGIMTVDKWFNKHGEHAWENSGGQAALDQLLAADAFVLGRKNYEGLAAVWPAMTDDVGFAERTNSLPKFVASRTLRGPLEWNSTLIEGDLTESINALKQRFKGSLLTFGLGEFSYQLLERGLVDEVRIWINPYIWGEGEQPLQGKGRFSFELKSTTTFDTGLVLMSYQPRPL